MGDVLRDLLDLYQVAPLELRGHEVRREVVAAVVLGSKFSLKY